jgi:hypothetical protein
MLVSGWLIKAHVVPIESTPVSLDPDPYHLERGREARAL